MARKKRVGRPVVAKAKRHGRTYAFRLTPYLDRVVQSECKRRGCSISELFRAMVSALTETPD